MNPNNLNPSELDAMTRYLHEHIPMTAALAVSVTAFDGASVHLHAPLAANINHRNTAFGGSLSTIGILAGWCLLHFNLDRLGLASRVVIQHSEMAFTSPGDDDFDARAELPAAETWERFCRQLERRGKARIALDSALTIGSRNIAEHRGVYVALLNPA